MGCLHDAVLPPLNDVDVCFVIEDSMHHLSEKGGGRGRLLLGHANMFCSNIGSDYADGDSSLMLKRHLLSYFSKSMLSFNLQVTSHKKFLAIMLTFISQSG